MEKHGVDFERELRFIVNIGGGKNKDVTPWSDPKTGLFYSYEVLEFTFLPHKDNMV